MLCRCQFLSIGLFLVAHTETLEKMDRILTEERFLLFSQRFIFRNTADLLHFMLHRVLSVTSVKKVCCHNDIPHTLRDELTCGSFQLSIWRLTKIGNALGFFTGYGIVIPFSVDLSDFCSSFREKRKTTIKIYISHHILLVNEVYNVIKRNSLFDTRTTI